MQLPENPFLPTPSRASAWAEGFTKGYLAISSPEPGENVGAEDIDAFNQGVASGEGCARTGIEFGDPCVAAAEESPAEAPLLTWNASEILHSAWDMRSLVWGVTNLAKVGEGIAGLVVVAIEIACSAKGTLPPEQVLPTLPQPVVDTLASYGFTSLELFCGAGLDPSATDCEIRVTPLFTSLDLARQAAIAMNRPQWLAAEWRTDQSNSFQIVDAGP
jgi:hypothetical protein